MLGTYGVAIVHNQVVVGSARRVVTSAHGIASARMGIIVQGRALCPSATIITASNGTMVVTIDIFIRQLYVRLYVEQLAHLTGYGKVEIEKKLPFPLKERPQVIGIIFEKRALAIGRLQGLPMEMPPRAMVRHAHVFHLRLVDAQALRALHGHGEGLRPLRGGYDTPVAVSLLDEMVVTLNEAHAAMGELLIPLHWTEISGREKNVVHLKRGTALPTI